MMNFTCKEWLAILIVLVLVLLLSGCAKQPVVERYKIIAGKPIIKTKVVTKKVTQKRNCPPLPALPAGADEVQKYQHHIKVIEMYVECAK